MKNIISEANLKIPKLKEKKQSQHIPAKIAFIIPLRFAETPFAHVHVEIFVVCHLNIESNCVSNNFKKQHNLYRNPYINELRAKKIIITKQ